jgi:hypothetical protein
MLIQIENSVLFMQSFLWTISDQCLEHHFEQAVKPGQTLDVEKAFFTLYKWIKNAF